MSSNQRTAGGDAFVYDINVRRSRLTDEQLLDGLRRFAAVWRKGRPFRRRDFENWKDRPFSAACVGQRFGSWGKALAKIGVRAAAAYTSDPGELVENLESVWRELRRPPGAFQLRRRGLYGAQAYIRRWGSVRRACELVAAHHRGEVAREELLRAGTGGRAVRKKLPVEVRWRVLKRDSYRCVACGKCPANEAGLELEVDHIVPVCRGGTNEEGNLRTLCGACNRGKRGGE